MKKNKHTVRYSTSLSDETATERTERGGETTKGSAAIRGMPTRHTTLPTQSKTVVIVYMLIAHGFSMCICYVIHSHEMTFCTSCTRWSMQKQQLNSWNLKPTRKIMWTEKKHLEKKKKEHGSNKLKHCAAAFFFTQWNRFTHSRQ